MPTRPSASIPLAPALLAAAGLALAATATLAQSDPLHEPFAAVLELADLDEGVGFRLDGVAEGDISGIAVASAGDMNGDGLDDLIIGAREADPGGRTNAGSTYVVFGRDGGWPGVVPLATLDGRNGFRLDGVEMFELSGRSVAPLGDINGDGIDDVIVGAYGADPDGREGAGSTYAIFGRAAGSPFPAVLRLSDLDGTNGFRLDGPDVVEQSGRSVASAGDFNADGVRDLIIGAPTASPSGRSRAGSSYVVFGRDTTAGAAFPAVLHLGSLDGTTGLRIDGVATRDHSGISVATAADANGDGIDDVIVGAHWGDYTIGEGAGSAYVVFGRDASAGPGFPPVLELATLDGSNGFALDGDPQGDYTGRSVGSAGDVNHDGIGDLIIGAYWANPSGRTLAGSSFVVFGRDAAAGSSFPAAFELATLDGITGFRIDGAASQEQSGIAVNAAGDLNGDGIDDLAIGAFAASPGDRFRAGTVYVVYGRDAATGPAFPVTLDLAGLDASAGLRINGAAVWDQLGGSDPAGDVNGDGLDDLIVGAPGAAPGGLRNAGSSYVIFGRLPTSCPADLDGDGTLTIFDFLAFGNLFDLMDPAADFDGDGDFTIFDFLAFQNAFDAGCG